MWHDLIFKDWIRKAVAIGFAMLIWLSVFLQIQQEESFRNVPVSLAPSNDFIVLDTELPLVTVTVRGSKKRIEEITSHDVKVLSKISPKAKPGNTIIKIRKGDVQVPFGITVLEVQPNQIAVNIDRVVSKEIAVRARFANTLPKGLEFKSKTVIPKTVRVIGPASVVEATKELLTEAIELGETVPFSFSVEKPLEKIPHTKYGRDTVMVYVDLYRKFDERQFDGLKLQILCPPDFDASSVKVIVPAGSKVRVRLQGPKNAIDDLTNASIRAFIDLTGKPFKAGTLRVPIQIWVNDVDAKVIDTKPDMAEVEIQPQNAPTPKSQPGFP